MADITKCGGFDCPKKEQCYRYTAPEGFWQSYFAKRPQFIRGFCPEFWDNSEYQTNLKDKE